MRLCCEYIGEFIVILYKTCYVLVHATKANQLIFFYTLDAKICARAFKQQKKTDLAFCQNVKKTSNIITKETKEKKIKLYIIRSSLMENYMCLLSDFTLICKSSQTHTILSILGRNIKKNIPETIPMQFFD